MKRNLLSNASVKSTCNRHARYGKYISASNLIINGKSVNHNFVESVVTLYFYVLVKNGRSVS